MEAIVVTPQLGSALAGLIVCNIACIYRRQFQGLAFLLVCIFGVNNEVEFGFASFIFIFTLLLGLAGATK